MNVSDWKKLRVEREADREARKLCKLCRWRANRQDYCLRVICLLGVCVLALVLREEVFVGASVAIKCVC